MSSSIIIAAAGGLIFGFALSAAVSLFRYIVDRFNRSEREIVERRRERMRERR